MRVGKVPETRVGEGRGRISGARRGGRQLPDRVNNDINGIGHTQNEGAGIFQALFRAGN